MNPQTATTTNLMDDLLAKGESQGFKIYQEGDLVEGTVRYVTRNRVWVDVDNGRFIGVVSGNELAEEGLSMPDYKPGDTIAASVLMPEVDEGYMVLSVREGLKNRGWLALEKLHKEGTIFSAKVVDANRGGLIIEAEGLRGFMPVSQLTPQKYPRVGNDKTEILNKLKKYVGEYFEVKVLDLDKESNKLIFSEKAAKQEEFSEMTSQIQEGDILKGKVSGVVDFGIFVSFGELEGLIHISEISWDKVDDPRTFAQPGDEIEVQVIGIEDGKISLSMKRLKADPWLELVKGYSIGQVLKGTVTELKPFGAFVKVDGKIDGLVHISEISYEHVENPGDVLKAGEEREFKVIDIEPESHRFGLSLKALQPAPEGAKVDSKKAAKMETDLREIGLSDAVIAKLTTAGINNLTALRGLSVEELANIPGIGDKTVDKIAARIKELEG